MIYARVTLEDAAVLRKGAKLDPPAVRRHAEGRPADARGRDLLLRAGRVAEGLHQLCHPRDSQGQRRAQIRAREPKNFSARFGNMSFEFFKLFWKCLKIH